VDVSATFPVRGARLVTHWGAVAGRYLFISIQHAVYQAPGLSRLKPRHGLAVRPFDTLELDDGPYVRSMSRARTMWPPVRLPVEHRAARGRSPGSMNWHDWLTYWVRRPARGDAWRCPLTKSSRSVHLTP